MAVISVGTKKFSALLEENATAEAFRKLLPLRLEMTELNRNEKYASLPASLPNAAFNPGTIEAGDIMLYGQSTIVIFYKSFKTTYSYTRIGKIIDVTGLTDALGKADVMVGFSVQ